LEGAISIRGQWLTPGKLGDLGRGRDELPLEASEPTKAVRLGGEPFEEPIVMWWNFVGRSQEEIESAYSYWQAQDDRFGTVVSSLPRIPAKPPFWLQPPTNG
jgi:quercetin 2,3-dioxygenase